MIVLLVLPLLSLNGVAAPMDKQVQAIYDNNLPELTAYLQAGGDANARTGRDNTLLMYASAFGTLDAMRLLLTHGADPNRKNAFDAAAIMWGVYDLDRVRLLLDKGADINLKAKSGTTALLLAALSPSGGDVVDFLAAHNADLTAQDGFGINLLQAGTSSGNLAAVRLALAHHADPNSKLRNGFTPLMNAAAVGSVEITKLLLHAGADPNAVSLPPGMKVKHGTVALGGMTPLILAAPYGPPAVIKLLLDAGAKVSPEDGRSMTALHAALSSEVQNTETVSLLLRKGADPAFQNKEGVSAMEWAQKFARPDLLQAVSYTPLSHKALLPGDSVRPPSADLALTRGISLMETSTESFFQQSGCVSCHSQNVTGMLAGVARSHGIPMNTEAATQRLAATKSSWAPQTEGLLIREDPPGGADMVSYALLGMAGDGYLPDLTTAAMARNLAAQQLPNGSWHRGGVARVPVEDSDIALTALVIRSLQCFANKGTQAEYSGRVRRAQTWLASAKPVYAEEWNMQLLGLKWAGTPVSSLSKMASAVEAKQRPSGGWGQNDYLPEDAYATGQTMFALSEAGRKTTDPILLKGKTYLLRTQASDGSWHVVSRAVKFQPFFQGGFPYDHDQWISSMGSAWATIALAATAH